MIAKLVLSEQPPPPPRSRQTYRSRISANLFAINNSAVTATERLTLGVLVATTSASKAILFAFDFTRIARDMAGFLQCWAISRINIQKRFGNPVFNCARLARKAAAANVDIDVETTHSLGQLK